MTQQPSRFGALVFLSIILHGVLGMVWLLYRPPVSTVTKSVDTITISVGLQAALAGASTSVPPVVAAPPEELVEQQEPEAIALPQPKRKPERKPEPKPKPKPEPKPEPKPQPKKPEPKKVEPRPAVKPELKVGAQGQSGSNSSEVKVEETGTQHVVGGAIDPNQFDYLIRHHLLSRKVQPGSIGTRVRRGTVVVEFTLDRQGRLLASKIATPSRVRAFDRAALKLVKSAEPFPPAPAVTSWQTRTFSIDVNYTVK